MQVGAKVDLFEGTNLLIGQLEVAEKTSDLLLGTFSPAPGYEKVRSLFQEFADLVDHQVLSLLDDLEERIGRLRIYGRCDGHLIPLYDIQIFGSAASVRLKPFGTS